MYCVALITKLLDVVQNRPSPHLPAPRFSLTPLPLTSHVHNTGERISLRDIKDFPLRLWMIFMVCVAYYVAVFPFIGLAVIFLMEKYGYEAKEANIINSLVIKSQISIWNEHIHA